MQNKINIVNFKDFKSRWGLESEFTIDFLYHYFIFFRDSLIELQDDNLISKFYIEYSNERVIIYKDLNNINDKLKVIFDKVLSKSGLFGDNKDQLIIYTNIFLPSSQFNDITLITDRIIDSVKFLKDNGKDLGFECNLKTVLPEGLRIEIIKNLVNE